jgi:hypothetical protein
MPRPRIRLRTLVAAVAVVALVMGAAIEIRNYQRWARSGAIERQSRDLAELHERLAEMDRRDGDTRSADRRAAEAAVLRGHAEENGREKRRLERDWYRYPGEPGGVGR